MFCVSAFGQDMYNIIATAYVTTTISQKVVFDSTMQSGGTFTFSALAHNGGGRPGQADTANVKIQFYTASNTLVSSVNSSYSSNLPLPNGVGTPGIDPTVPWTTLTVSSVNCGGSCANVAYATVSMYGVDGSYWAGDYGPWYRAPTFTLDGGSNMVYNPEFGPAYGYNAQGWTTSPAMGACQGAWGGSNPCIANSSGAAGQNTTGLVANQNGGGPSTTGGTTSGQPGGYNSAMSTTNANPAPKTVVSTSVSYTSRTSTSGNTVYTYRTPVTTTTYSDNSTSTSNGTETLYSTAVTTTQTKSIIVGAQLQTVNTPTTVTTYSDNTSSTTYGNASTTVVSSAAFTGVHFGPAQVADTQWDVGACTQTNTCNIYSTAPGMTYNLTYPTTIASDQYVTFVPNTGADSATNPWQMLLVNSDGTFTSLGTGHILVQGADASGNIYLFFSNDYWNGTLLSGNLGLSGQGMSFTGTASPAPSDTNTFATYMSSNPLTAGQSGGSGMPSGPTVVGGTITQTNAPTTQTIGSGPSYTAPSDSADKQTRVDTWTNSSQQYNNMLYIDQVGENNTVNITQTGDKNRIDMTINGNGNNITNTQTGSNYLKIDVPGWGNTINTSQTNTTGSNYAETKIQGNGNTVNHTQTGNGNQVLFSKITGDINTVTTTQSGSAGHIADVTLTGNYNNASIDQSGSTANKANVNLTNAGGPASVDLQQTGGKSVTIIQSCSNPAGCSTTIRQ